MEIGMTNRRSFRYRVVDVFTKVPLEGNALGVFPDSTGIDDATMQKIAKELNLAETTFLAPPTRSDCVAKVRIFTPAREMAFAGHPTVGTSFVMLDEGMVPKKTQKFVLEEGVGPVTVRVESGERPMIWLRTPPIEFGREYGRAECAQTLGLDENDLLDVVPQIVSAANPAVFVALKDKSAVDRAWLDVRSLQVLKGKNAESFFVFVFSPTADGAYSRMFAPEHGVPEDPATGSATGPLAAFMMKHELVSRAAGTRFVSEQGTKMARPSFLHVRINGENGKDGIEVGGHVTPVVEATLTI
jgi:trans-2,3-dihydro-3-hydroxyanthranilate isomerase